MILVRISHEFQKIFVQFANTQSKHTSKHPLHAHGQVNLHAPVFAHLGNRHAGTVFTRCQSVVGRTRGAMPVMAKWISDSASTLSPLQTSSWCTLPTKNSMHCSPTSMTALRGACWDRLGGVREEGLGSLPLPQPHPPNRPLPNPQHLVHAGAVPAGQIPSYVQGLFGGDGVQVCGVGLVLFVSGVGGPQVKNSPLCKVFVQPIFSLFSVYFPDICVQTEIGYLSTVLDSVGISQSGISVVLHSWIFHHFLYNKTEFGSATASPDIARADREIVDF